MNVAYARITQHMTEEDKVQFDESLLPVAEQNRRARLRRIADLQNRLGDL